MEKKGTGYFTVAGRPLSLAYAAHDGTLTKEDIKINLLTAIERSNECAEDWLADLQECWYQKSGIIMPTVDKNLLVDRERMEYEVGEMLDEWGYYGSKASFLLHEAGYNEELEPMNYEEMELFYSDEADRWTLRTIITEHLPYEEPIL